MNPTVVDLRVPERLCHVLGQHDSSGYAHFGYHRRVSARHVLLDPGSGLDFSRSWAGFAVDVSHDGYAELYAPRLFWAVRGRKPKSVWRRPSRHLRRRSRRPGNLVHPRHRSVIKTELQKKSTSLVWNLLQLLINEKQNKNRWRPFSNVGAAHSSADAPASMGSKEGHVLRQ